MNTYTSKTDTNPNYDNLRPWLGRVRFRTPPVERPRPRRLVAETGEEQGWRRLCPRVFAPGHERGPLVRALEHVTVTPIAHVTLLNLDYQIYLNQLMHTSAGAWIGHIVCIPINVALLFYALAFHTGSGAWGPDASLVLLALLASWYLAMAARLRSTLWGVVAAIVLGALWALAQLGFAHVCALATGCPWYLRPLPLIAAVSAVQAYSHLFEEHVPPRANFERRWIPVREFIWADPEQVALGRRLLRLAWTPIGGLWGALDEWWASAKLLPLYLLELLWMCGYRRDQRDHFRRVTIEALASGDPALDWVGVGGGDSVAALGEPSADELGDVPVFHEPEPSWSVPL